MRISYLIEQMLLVSLLIVGFSLPQALAEDVGNPQMSRWTTGLGTGVVFFEGDEEFNNSWIVEAKVGYDIDDSFTLEGSFGYLPDMAANSRTENDPAAWHLHSTQGFRGAVDLIYYLDEVQEEGAFRAHLAATGGTMYYSNSLSDGDHLEPFVGVGAGVGYAVDRHWTVRGDYRLLVAVEDGEINHYPLVSVIYRWDQGSDVHSVYEDPTAIRDDSADQKAKTEGSLKAIYFDFDKAVLTPSAKSQLEQNSQWLRENPTARLTLEGHCDERGTNEYNLALGERRAHSAKVFLKSLDIDPARIDVISYGEEYPSDPRSNEEAWAKNRRVECVLHR